MILRLGSSRRQANHTNPLHWWRLGFTRWRVERNAATWFRHCAQQTSTFPDQQKTDRRVLCNALTSKNRPVRFAQRPDLKKTDRCVLRYDGTWLFRHCTQHAGTFFGALDLFCCSSRDPFCCSGRDLFCLQKRSLKNCIIFEGSLGMPLES